MHRQGHNKRGAPIDFRREFKRAAVYFDGLLDDGQAQAGALNAGDVAGAEECFKEPLVRIGRNAQAVIGYADDLRPLRERLRATGPGADGRYRDGAGNAVEDFGLPLNLMLAVPLQLAQGGIEAALAALERSVQV